MKTIKYNVEIHYNDNDKWSLTTWYQDGQYHRLDGPAVEHASGHKEWHQYGKFHRLDGPAIERANGDKLWYQEGKLHRLDGPAYTDISGYKSFYIKGDYYSDEDSFRKEINKLIKLDFANLMIEIEGTKYQLNKV